MASATCGVVELAEGPLLGRKERDVAEFGLQLKKITENLLS
jgi:hypothetical protein